MNMEHMKYLENVAARDVALLREKEATYQGSWKRAGGRSAWFMLRRNMDRLLTMMKPPPMVHGFSLADLDDCIESAKNTESGDTTVDYSIMEYLRDCYVAEDIFAKVEEHPQGEDGTVLACIRDLRCYLILVEAEMMARGSIEKPKTVTLVLDDMKKENVERAFAGSEGDRFVGMKVEELVPKERAVESWPWIISIDETRNLTSEELQFYVRRGENYFLEDVMEGDLVPFLLEKYYFHHNGHMFLDLSKVPPQIRGNYKSLSRELNDKEYRDLPVNRQCLYELCTDTKYHLKPEFAAWGRDA